MKFYTLTILFFLNLSLSAQIKNKGLPFIKNYSANNNGTPLENWEIKQDPRGIIYIANNKGLVEFDGTSWRIYPVSNKSIVRSLDIAPNGRIYVGAEGEFGYLEPDKRGEFIYHSLFNKIPPESNKFSDVWKTIVTDQGIVFQTSTAIFVYKNNKVKVYHSRSSISVCAYVYNKILVNEENYGLSELTSDRLALIKNGGAYATNHFKLILPYEDDKILLASPQQGFFIYDSHSFAPWDVPTNDFIINNKIVNGTILGKDNYIITTHQNGLIVINKEGKAIQQLNKSKGLQSNTIQDAFIDRSGGLWLALNNGIDYIEITSPFTFFDYKNNVPGTPHTVALHKNHLYIGTSEGVFFNEWKTYATPLDSSRNFRFINNTTDEVWNLTSLQNTLLCGHHEGAFEIMGGSAKKISKVLGGWIFLSLKNHPDYLLQGTYSGLSLFKKQRGSYSFDRTLNFNESSRVMIEDNDGSIWISNTNLGVFRIQLNEKPDSIVRVSFYNSKNGFPSNLGINVFKINQEVLFCAERGIYQYDNTKDKFILNKKWNRIFDPKKHVRKLLEDKNGDIWFSIEDEVGVMRRHRPGESYTKEILPFKNLNGKLLDAFELFYPIDERNILIGSKDYVAHYDPQIKKNYHQSYNVLIRKVELVSGSDSLIFGGNFRNEQGGIISFEPMAHQEIFSRKQNYLRFTYSSPFFEGMDKMQYKYWLKGFDQQWSSWSGKTLKEYTNLPPGKYKFQVKARNVYDKETSIATYTFEIEPSWYETWWFYTIQITFFIMLLSFSYFSSRSGKQTKISNILTFLTIITIFEFCILFIEPYVDNFTGGVPLFKLGMNVLLALSLNPVEDMFKRIFIGKQTDL